jgi:two-component system sensor histidine kinase KdpD
MNLLENAVFHAAGMKNLWLTVEIQKNQALFRVADDGCGIPPERLEDLFTGFRGSVPSDRGRSNMGIGLSVCSAIVKAHGGRIWARNREEGGAEFLFTLEMEKKTHGE